MILQATSLTTLSYVLLAAVGVVGIVLQFARGARVPCKRPCGPRCTPRRCCTHPPLDLSGSNACANVAVGGPRQSFRARFARISAIAVDLLFFQLQEPYVPRPFVGRLASRTCDELGSDRQLDPSLIRVKGTAGISGARKSCPRRKLR